jgi:hypothetical protein
MADDTGRSCPPHRQRAFQTVQKGRIDPALVPGQAIYAVPDFFLDSFIIRGIRKVAQQGLDGARRPEPD